MNYQDLTVEYKLSMLLEGIRAVTTKLDNLKNRLEVPFDDGRRVGLSGMELTLTGLGLTVHAISGAGLRSTRRTLGEVQESFTNYVEIEGKNQEQLMAYPESFWRWSLLTIFHFRLDTLFQNLLRALGTDPGKSGFGANSNKLLELLSLSDEKQARNILAVATHLRNSLHNNGIHRGTNWGPFVLNGLSYEFQQDRDVRCASIGHILNVLDAIADVLADIFFSPEVRALPSVEDRYVDLIPS